MSDYHPTFDGREIAVQRHVCTDDCTRGWGPSGRSHCSECGENFTTVSNFDRHRTKDGHCQAPASVGLVRNPRGFWQRPGDYLAETFGEAS